MVANLNLLEMLIVLAELEAEDFRQAPNICNVLGTMQSNNTEKTASDFKDPTIWQKGHATQIDNREQKKSGYDYLPKYNRNSKGGQSREGEMGTCLAIAKSTAQYPTLGNFRSC